MSAAPAAAPAAAPPALDPKKIDGRGIAKVIRAEIKDKIDALVAGGGERPGLAVVLVGSRKDSATYVRMKKKACAEVGIVPFDHEVPADARGVPPCTLLSFTFFFSTPTISI